MTPGAAEHGRGRRADPPEPEAPACVMSIHAHPDDQEFTVGGTLAKWARAGTTVVTVCLTSGGAGSNEATPLTMTRAELALLREQEQRNACSQLGIGQIEFLRYEDGMLEPSLALRRDLTRLIRRHRPDAVVCGDPTVRFYGSSYLNHPDHRVAADVALDAVYPSASTRLIFPELLDEGLEPHRVGTVLVHGSKRPDTFIDIADLFEIKLVALREHRSQIGEWDPSEMLTEWAREQGKRRGLVAAEAFRRMVLNGA